MGKHSVDFCGILLSAFALISTFTLSGKIGRDLDSPGPCPKSLVSVRAEIYVLVPKFGILVKTS